MRTTEGVGLVAPRPAPVRITEGDRRWALAESRRRTEFRRYSDRPDPWGVGLLNNSTLSVYVGLVGELAFTKWFHQVAGRELPVDVSPRIRGDGGIDFRACGYGIQVKTAASDYGDLLVRSDHAACAEWDIIVRVQWPPRRQLDSGGLFPDAGPRQDRSAAHLCGWAWRIHFERLAATEYARRGEHWNKVLPPERFQAMGDLAALFQARLLKGVL